ncbi:MAG TPA: heparinase II/III family protein [Kiritimatiellia bacterium]|nr:heparinase II/III family protein [Kiritimatiellia bacterium]HPS09100.1 heparinase II/III family protein [Kiritimatiellia bacterium]
MRLIAVSAVVSLGLAVTLLQAEAFIPAEKTALQTVADAVRKADKRHPSLFGDAQTFATLREQAGIPGTVKQANDRIMFDADQMMGFPPCAREMEGRRLLGVSRRALHRISTLAMAYRLSGKPAYLERCASEMRAVAAFSDWNPSHFLDVAEMTLAMAVGYDWLYNDMDEATRKAVADAILEKGLRTSLKHTGWVKASNNWGQVCHAGMLAGALALMDQQEALAAEITHRAITNLPRPMHAFAPKGCYPEGPGYWSYGTDFNVLAIALLEGVLKSDYGLTALPGFAATADYLDLVTGPSGMTFNYADGGMGRGTDCASWWFAKRFGRPDVLSYFERDAFRTYCDDRSRTSATQKGNRLFAFTLFWLQPLPADLATKAPLAWSSEGPVPITIQRTSWDNGKALFIGLKAGSPSAPHGHMDAGSFVLDAEGVRWAYDIGAESYHRIESRKMDLWSSKQNADRWRIFRLSSLSHNTLVIDGQLQFAKGTAKVLSFRETPESEAVLDLSPVYTNAAQVIRTGTLLADGEYRMTDTLKGLRPGSVVRWAMATKATPDTSRTGLLVLREAGRQLILSALHDPSTAWKTYEAARTGNEWDSENPGMKLVGFEAAAPSSGELTLTVRFTPGNTLKIEGQ